MAMNCKRIHLIQFFKHLKRRIMFEMSFIFLLHATKIVVCKNYGTANEFHLNSCLHSHPTQTGLICYVSLKRAAQTQVFLCSQPTSQLPFYAVLLIRVWLIIECRISTPIESGCTGSLSSIAKQSP